MGNSVPIGRPISNTELYIVDQDLEPVPAGVAGQIMIGGDGLARGYLHHPGLTAEKFVPDPFSGRAGARLYQTGDLARYRSDGAIEFLGRVDGQIKLRGFRIELGEVEAVLSGHPWVRQAVVVEREENEGDKSLAAYVVGNNRNEVATTELRSYLRQKLPEYMVPGSYMVLSELPLTPNGKVDRRALPQPDPSQSPSSAAYVAPESAIEQTIADVWKETLQLERVGAHDNFFDLGGHSLLLVKVFGRLRGLLEKEISMTDLFRHPTVSSLARYLSAEQDAVPSFPQAQDRARKQREAIRRRKQAMKARSM
jgi:acyl carrier protein